MRKLTSISMVSLFSIAGFIAVLSTARAQNPPQPNPGDQNQNPAVHTQNPNTPGHQMQDESNIHTMNRNRPMNPNMNVTVQDFEEGVSFQLHPDGKVELNVMEVKNGNKTESTYKADSIEDFRQKYPQIAEKYQIERFVPRRGFEPFSGNMSPRDWENWKRGFANDWFWDHEGHQNWMNGTQSEPLNNWFNEQRRLFHEFQNLPAPNENQNEVKSGNVAGGPTFGIMMAPVSEVLANQLDLEPQAAIVVQSVQPDSIAAKSGVQRDDIVVKLNGKTISGPEQFRDEIHSMLDKGFTLDVIRKGRHQTIDVKPGNQP